MNRIWIYLTLGIVLLPAAFAAGWLLQRAEKPDERTPTEGRKQAASDRYACPISREAVEGAYANAHPEKGRTSAKAAIVNHHLLAADLIAKTFSMIEPEIKTVVLISPNHFGAGDAKVITTDRDWESCYGKLLTDGDLVDRLSDAGLASVQDGPFDFEHGIYNLMPFIGRSFPNAKVVPLIVKENAENRELDDLAAFLARQLKEDAVVVGSFDFSHETTDRVADAQDKNSIKAIQSLDPEAASGVTVDSRQGLRAVMAYVSAAGGGRFLLNDNTNSARMTGKPSSTDVTSYVTGYFP